MNPEMKRFYKRYQPIYDAVASADLDQEDREAVAKLIAANLAEARALGRHRDLFVLLASDPLVPCAGYELADGAVVPCPQGRVIRIGMHLSEAPDGRSAAWRQRAPYGHIRCVSCGATHFRTTDEEVRA